MFPLRKNILLDENGTDGGDTQTTTIDTASDTSTDKTQAQTVAKPSKKPSDEALSKIKFDTSDMDDGQHSAPSEKGDFEGVFSKLPKLLEIKKDEPQGKDSKDKKEDKKEE